VVSTTQQASPTVTDNTLQANAQAGVAFLGTSRGAVGGNACSGGVAGLVLGGSAQPTLSGTAGCPVHDERTG
jgi:parallel beta-helix repeat protein